MGRIGLCPSLSRVYVGHSFIWISMGLAVVGHNAAGVVAPEPAALPSTQREGARRASCQSTP